MEPVTLLVLVDGLRHDYVNPVDAPFLYSLSELNPCGAVQETFAFQLRPAFLAGLHPEQCGIAHLYLYDPEHSPYKNLPSNLCTREEICSWVRSVEHQRGHSASAFYADPFAVPRQLLPYFSFSERVLTWEENALSPYSTVFDLLHGLNLEYLVIAYPSHDQRTSSILQSFENQIKPDHRFVFLHFAELDWAGHEFGPGSSQQRECLRQIDQALMQIYSVANQKFSYVNSIIFGDHGMVAVKHLINVQEILEGLNLSVGKDYVFFLDSTQARFWFHTERARLLVESTLGSLPGGHFLSDEEIEHLRFRFADRRFGELIWAADAGYLIFPNFFQREVPPRGMHGYLPHVSDNWGWICVTGGLEPNEWERPVIMTRIFPTLVDMLGLKESIVNPEQENRSLIIPNEPSSCDVSIVIPTRNRASTLNCCLHALLRQSYPHNRMEVIIVDDGSSDGTEEVVTQFVQDSDISVIYKSITPSGPAAARNCGVRIAKGSVILFIGDDIICTPDLVAKHMEFHSGASFSESALGWTGWDPKDEVTPFMQWLEQAGIQFDYDAVKAAKELDFGSFWTCNLSLKRDFIKTHGLFDERFTAAVWEDIELGYRLKRVGLRLVYVPDACAYHRHPTTVVNYAQRQWWAGYFGALMMKLCPELEANIIQRAQLVNPYLAFLLADEQTAHWLMSKAEGQDVDMSVYQSIMAWFFGRGLLEGLKDFGLPHSVEKAGSAADFLLNRSLLLMHEFRMSLASKGDGDKADNGFPASKGLWITAGARFQIVANRIYNRLPSWIGHLYMRARRKIIGW